ncbi:MAG: nicotinate (nicotinamide) nucleotide adenylyltransferase, partial [Desulfovibrionales bacterium]|nr:nicotinate (nicotinamide) nucleotide adenylyltransferase [Desulfovibrionales bacterium]
MAIEVRETLGLKRVDLLPARIPPHKSSSGLLPFSLRLDLVREAVQGIDGLEVSDLEGQMPVPSYSYLTLVRLA